jgi:hypothetical protein
MSDRNELLRMQAAEVALIIEQARHQAETYPPHPDYAELLAGELALFPIDGHIYDAARWALSTACTIHPTPPGTFHPWTRQETP